MRGSFRSTRLVSSLATTCVLFAGTRDELDGKRSTGEYAGGFASQRSCGLGDVGDVLLCDDKGEDKEVDEVCDLITHFSELGALLCT